MATLKPAMEIAGIAGEGELVGMLSEVKPN
jgi:hypothetical protein